MKEKLLKLKEELKTLTLQIRTNKALYKQAQRDSDWKKQWEYNPSGLSSDFRHKHIAYCLLRGRTMEQIESKGERCIGSHRWGCNCPDMNLVESIMNEVKDEGVRDSEVGSVEVSASSSSGTCSDRVDEMARIEAISSPHSGVSKDAKLGILNYIKGLFR